MYAAANEVGAFREPGCFEAVPVSLPVERPNDDDREVPKSFLVGGTLPESINPRVFNGYAEHLIKIDWSVIGWLTWANQSYTYRTEASEQKRRTDFYSLIDSVCGYFHLRHRHLLYYHKAEWGNGRGHYHFLLGRQGTEKVTPRELADTMRRFWDSGRAVVEPFDSDIQGEGVLYQSKYEFDRDGHARLHPDNASPMLQKVWRRMASCSSSTSRN